MRATTVLVTPTLMVIAALLTSLTIAREWENGTMEQLITTPLKPIELIIGKLTPYFLIGMFDVLFAVLMGQYQHLVPRGLDGAGLVAGDMPGVGAEDSLVGAQNGGDQGQVGLCAAGQKVHLAIRRCA